MSREFCAGVLVGIMLGIGWGLFCIWVHRK